MLRTGEGKSRTKTPESSSFRVEPVQCRSWFNWLGSTNVWVWVVPWVRVTYRRLTYLCTLRMGLVFWDTRTDRVQDVGTSEVVMDETRSESCMLGSSKEYCVYPMTEPSERRRGVIPSPGIFVSVSTSKNPFTTKLPHESPLWVSPHSPRPLPSPSSSHSYSPL